MSLLTPEEIRLLTEVGFLGGRHRYPAQTRAIFNALEMFRPTASSPYVGLALAAMSVREHDEAIRVLDRGMTQVDSDDLPELQAMRILALRLAGRSVECERAVKEAAGNPMVPDLLAQMMPCG